MDTILQEALVMVDALTDHRIQAICKKKGYDVAHVGADGSVFNKVREERC